MCCSQPMSLGRSTSSMEDGDSKLCRAKAKLFSVVLITLKLLWDACWKWQWIYLHGNVLFSRYSPFIKSNQKKIVRNILLKSWPVSDCANFISNKPLWAVNTFLVCTNPPASHLPAALAALELSDTDEPWDGVRALVSSLSTSHISDFFNTGEESTRSCKLNAAWVVRDRNQTRK